MSRNAILVGLVLAVAPSATARADSWSLGGGVFEVLAMPGASHAGVYLLGGVSRVVDCGGFFLAPGLALEASPDQGRWGGVSSVTIDVPVSASVGLDLSASVFSDQHAGDFGNVLFIGALTPGLSFYAKSWTVSPMLSFYRVFSPSSWGISPGLVLSRTLR